MAAEAAQQQLKTAAACCASSSRPVAARVPRLCRQQPDRCELSQESAATRSATAPTATKVADSSPIVNQSRAQISLRSQRQRRPNSTDPASDETLANATTNGQRPNSDNQQQQQQQQADNNSRRVPTFGSTPERVRRAEEPARLPYFSYYGRARNVSLVRSADRPQNFQQQPTTAGSTRAQSVVSSSRSVSSLSQSNLCGYQSSRSSSAEPSEILGQKAASARRSAVALLKRGYSNISNLFPDKPHMTTARNQSRRSSLADLSNRRPQQQQYSAASAHSSTLTGQRRRPASRSTLELASTGSKQPGAATATEPNMSRHNNNNNNPSATSQQQQQFYSHKPQRPNSATGLRRRSPSSSSLYQSSQPRGPQYVGAWTYQLDPDCPVHGQSGGPCSPGGATISRSNQHLAPAHGGQAAADLLYADAQADDDEQQQQQQQQQYHYNHSHSHRTVASAQNRRGGSLYSPSSPLGWRDQTANSQAYYNGASRFSLYSGTTDSGRPRSSLAPAQEQVRRILGYQPRNLLVTKPVYLHPQWAYNRPFIHLLGTRSAASMSPENYLDDADLDNEDDAAAGSDDMGPTMRRSRQAGPRFAAFNQLQDAQAIRAVDFHPSGQVYAIGSNSRALRICAYPAVRELKQFSGEQDESELPAAAVASFEPQAEQEEPGRGVRQTPTNPRVLFKFLQVHRGSIYCVAFNGGGQLLATGSNDQTVHLVRYNPRTHTPDGDEFRLSMHDGTVRELCFIDDTSGGAGGGSSLLLSAGGGDNKIYVTDCDTVTPFQSMAGHTHMVMGLHHVGGAQFVSCSQDRTIRFWDLRTRGCTSIISAPAAPAQPMAPVPHSQVAAAGFGHEPIVPAKPGPGAPVCAVRVDPSGRLLASGHSDSTCMLYDIRAGRIIQAFKPHRDEVRSVSFAPGAHYMLTGGYDGRLVLTDLQGDLSQALPSVCVAECGDKVVQAKWHPHDYTFVSTSADRTATLWALPAQI